MARKTYVLCFLADDGERLTNFDWDEWFVWSDTKSHHQDNLAYFMHKLMTELADEHDQP